LLILDDLGAEARRDGSAWSGEQLFAIMNLDAGCPDREPPPGSRIPRPGVAARAAVRTLHDASLPPWPSSQCQQQPACSSRGTVECPPELDSECRLLVANNVVSADVVRRNPLVAEAALRPRTPVFIHGDLQIVHVLDDGDEASGVGDWSEGGQGDAMYDLATLTLTHEEHLYDVMARYGGHIEIDVIRAYWSLRSLMEIRWLVSTATARRRRSHRVAVLNALSASS
jgi:aminoglycoside phosphotransferase (APT) family kinase protein